MRSFVISTNNVAASTTRNRPSLGDTLSDQRLRHRRRVVGNARRCARSRECGREITDRNCGKRPESTQSVVQHVGVAPRRSSTETASFGGEGTPTCSYPQAWHIFTRIFFRGHRGSAPSRARQRTCRPYRRNPQRTTRHSRSGRSPRVFGSHPPNSQPVDSAPPQPFHVRQIPLSSRKGRDQGDDRKSAHRPARSALIVSYPTRAAELFTAMVG